MQPALRVVHPSTIPKQQGRKAEALQYKKPASLTFLKTVGYPKVAKAVDLGVRRDLIKSGWSQAVKNSHKSPHTWSLQDSDAAFWASSLAKSVFKVNVKVLGWGWGME